MRLVTQPLTLTRVLLSAEDRFDDLAAEELFVTDRDLLLFDTLSSIDWTADPVLVMHCTTCNFIPCSQRRRATLRAAGDYVVLFPDWLDLTDAIIPAPAPYFVERDTGAVVVPVSELHRLATPQLRPLTSDDALRIAQWEDPYAFLGSFRSRFTFDRDDLLASEDGDTDAAIDHLRATLDRFDAAPSPCTVRPLRPDERPVGFFLDRPDHPLWPSPALAGRDDTLVLRGGLVVQLLK